MKYFARQNQLGEIDLDKGDHLINPYPSGFSKVEIPEGKSGPWRIRKFTPGPEIGMYNLRLIRDGHRQRIVPPGTYTKLERNGSVIMSDTPAEAHEHYSIYKHAKGRVVIGGLGIGFVLKAILSKESVTSVTVVEFSRDVIRLVKPSIKDSRVKIIQADIMKWKPDTKEKFDAAWFDIWDTIDDENLREMRELRSRRWAKWSGCWSQEYI